MLRTLFSFRGLIFVLVLVAVGLPVALVGQLGIVRTLNAINLDVARLRQGQLAAKSVLQLQVDEESAIRGYEASRQRPYLDPYFAARGAMSSELEELQASLTDTGPRGVENRTLATLLAVNAEWLHTVAEPVVAGAALDETRAVRGKLLIDRFRAEIRPIERELDVRYGAAIARREATISTTSTTATVAIAAIGLEIVVFGIVIARLRRALDRDRAVVESLQIAASTRMVPPPHLRIGTAYRSATRGARVGGDVYDVYRLDDDRTLVVVGDVSGKGLTAAVDTTFVRFAVRALASDALAPDEIVRRFDALYRDANSAPESFVTLFVGIHDRGDGLLAYTNAGHEAAWIRRPGALEMLAPTGPIVGLGGFPFFAAQTAFERGDLLVLATDGLTEARDPSGGFIPPNVLHEWLSGPAADPQGFVDEIVQGIARYTRGRITDDLAVLAVAPLP